MDDLELTKKINSLAFDVDLTDKTVKCELVHYKIIERKDGSVDLKSTWISPDMPPVSTVINGIQRQAVDEYKKATGRAR